MRLILLSAALLIGGCASLQPSKQEKVALNRVVQAAADQVKPCYRAPRVASSGKQISTRLLIRFRPDGGLAQLPVLVGQGGVTANNQAYADAMARAASLAVLRCSPINLPSELYQKGWSVLELTFSHTVRA